MMAFAAGTAVWDLAGFLQSLLEQNHSVLSLEEPELPLSCR